MNATRKQERSKWNAWNVINHSESLMQICISTLIRNIRNDTVIWKIALNIRKESVYVGVVLEEYDSEVNLLAI